MNRLPQNLLATIFLAALLLGAAWAGTPAQPANAMLPTPQPPQDPVVKDPLKDPETAKALLAGSVAPQPTGGPDQFGYTWDAVGEYAWAALPAPQLVSFSSADDGHSAPLEIGFAFKFYEKEYSQLYIGTNGLISFEKPLITIPRMVVPNMSEPNNIIVPFGDDLAVGGDYNDGKVVYQTLGTAGSRQMVIIFERVTLLGYSDELTFEVILFEASGDILINYKTMSGVLDQATVAIEDFEGLDGLLYLQYESGLASGSAVRFRRPAPAARIKLLEPLKGNFVTGGVAQTKLHIRNTGEMGSDSYNLQADLLFPAGSPDWSISFLDETSQALLSDHTSDGLVDTGPVQEGQTVTVIVQIKRIGPVTVGEYARHQVRLASAKDDSQDVLVEMQSAVPASFAQAYVDIEFGVGLDVIWSGQRTSSKMTDWFSGSTLGITSLPNQSLVYIWERNDTNSNWMPYTDLEYALTDSLGRMLRTRVKLTSNASTTNPTWEIADRHPSLAAMPDGSVVVAWVREITDHSSPPTKKSNVSLLWIGPDGDPVGLPAAVTDYDSWQPTGTASIIQSVSVAPVGNSRHAIAWEELHSIGGEWTSDIYFAVASSTGSLVSSPAAVTQSIPGEQVYFSTSLADLTGKRTFLAYSQQTTTSTSPTLTYAYSVGFTVFDQNGAVLKGQTAIAGAAGVNPDVVQLSSGQILVAWTVEGTNRIGYVLLDGTSYQPLSSLQTLENPDDRLVGYPSVTRDAKGHGILSWMDAQWNNYLYYALVDNHGAVLTPPMSFYPNDKVSNYVITSRAGQGNASYEGRFYVFLPAMNR